MIDIEREQADEGLTLLHDTRKRRRHHVCPIRADDEVDLVDIEQLRVDARHCRRVGLVVVIDELDGTAEQPALAVDLFFPDLGTEQRLLAGSRKRAGLRHAEPDLDGFTALRKSGRGRPCGGNESGTDAGIYVAPGHAMGHGFSSTKYCSRLRVPCRGRHQGPDTAVKYALV